MAPIYLDNHATTAVDPRVLERLLPYLTEHFGNASSRSHAYGWRAESAVDAARGEVATLLGASSREIIFTSGATESNNLAILGVAEAYAGQGKHIITQATEHKAVLDPCAMLAKRGWEVTVLPVDAGGRVTAEQVAQALRPDTVLVSIMLANNEIGTVQPIGAIGKVCRGTSVLLHTDAVQGLGRVPFDVERDCVDLVSLTAHKLYGPKGVGALYLRRRNPRVQLAAQQFGGGQERGLRPGTLNVPGIVGLGAACALAHSEGVANAPATAALRDALAQTLRDGLGEDRVVVHGDPTHRHPGNLNVCLKGVEAELLLMGLPELALSSGAACASTTMSPSHVLSAIGVSDKDAHCTLRFGVGRFNTDQEIQRAGAMVVEAAKKARRG